MSAENIMMPFTVEIDFEKGRMVKPARQLVRKAFDMKGHYKDVAALKKLIANGNPVHYEVQETPVPEKYGQLMYCISILQPGAVGDECFMTKGHYHTIPETAEIYLCLKGEGFMMMKTADGKCDWQKMSRGRMVYVPPCWAHRSINIGKEELVSFCVYPGDAGHNYGDIEKQGFPKRVFLRNGKVVIE